MLLKQTGSDTKKKTRVSKENTNVRSSKITFKFLIINVSKPQLTIIKSLVNHLPCLFSLLFLALVKSLVGG